MYGVIPELQDELILQEQEEINYKLFNYEKLDLFIIRIIYNRL